MDKNKAHTLIDQASFKFAYSMPSIPHEYSHRDIWQNDNDFVDLVLFIRKNGIKEQFLGREYIYYYYNGYKYWTLGNPVCRTDKTKTFILNRAKC
jgi:hypothetical protein